LGKAGRLFARDSEEELYNHLKELVFDSQERERLAKAARERALGFTWAEAWRKFGAAIF
jgi:hypothetical protein